MSARICFVSPKTWYHYQQNCNQPFSACFEERLQRTEHLQSLSRHRRAQQLAAQAQGLTMGKTWGKDTKKLFFSGNDMEKN
jgi:hypothetical protein